MSKTLPPFDGFSKELFKFFKDLEKNNSVKWFNENRSRYDDYLVTPSKSFIVSIGEFFNQLNPSIRTEPKFNKTLMRINKDMRFAKGAPYKNYFLIHFGRFKMDSEFYVYFDKEGVDYGIFLNNSGEEDLYFNQNLKRFKKQIIQVFKDYKLNNKFRLMELKREPTLVKEKFNAQKDFDILENTKYLLLEKSYLKDEKIIYSVNLVTELIKIFSVLYPVYCFAISPQPMKLLKFFEENLGTAH